MIGEHNRDKNMATNIVNGGYTVSKNTVSVPSAGLAGAVLTTTGATTGTIASVTGMSNTTWAHPNAQFNNGSGVAVMTIPHGENKVVLEDKAELEVKGKVKINGLDLEERLRTIETVLNIPERDATLEAKHPKLKELYDAYINALAKYRTWEKLKDPE